MFCLNFPFTSFIDNTWYLVGWLPPYLQDVTDSEWFRIPDVILLLMSENGICQPIVPFIHCHATHCIFQKQGLRQNVCIMQDVLRINTFGRGAGGSRVRQREKSVCTAGQSLSQPHQEFWKVCSPSELLLILVKLAESLQFPVNYSVDIGCPRRTSLLGKRLSVTLKQLRTESQGRTALGEWEV